MNLVRELVSKIHKSVNNNEYAMTRKYIEENIELLLENRTLLKGNARELLDYIVNKEASNHPIQLTRQELMAINAINTNAIHLNVRGINNILKDHPTLLLKNDIIYYLKPDAKVLLECMGLIRQS